MCFLLDRRMKRFFYRDHERYSRGTYYMWEKATFPKGIRLLDGIGLRVFVGVTVENNLNWFYTDRKKVSKKAWCNFHSAVNTTTWEWTSRHSEWNHEMQRERDFPMTLIDLPACARTHRNFSFCHWTEDLWYILRVLL